MRCLICNENLGVEALKIHCQYYHSINEIIASSKSFFHQKIIQKNVMSVRFSLRITDRKKNHNFLFHRYQQTAGAINQQLPINVLKRGPITYYSINFYQHENFYDFYDKKIVDRFFNSVRNLFVSGGKELKMQGF